MSSVAHSRGNETMVIAAVEIAKAAKLIVLLKTSCVVCVKSAANPSTMIAKIMAKTKQRNKPTVKLSYENENLLNTTTRAMYSMMAVCLVDRNG